MKIKRIICCQIKKQILVNLKLKILLVVKKLKLQKIEQVKSEWKLFTVYSRKKN